MRSPLVYLTVTKLKNQLLAVVKSPAKLAYAILLVALFAFTAFSGSAYDVEEMRNPQELVAIMTLFYTMMFLMVFASGSSSSNSPMFTLSDVTLLFPAPLSSNKILVYGLVRQLGLSLVLGFFILFQYSWMHGVYGVEPVHLALIIGGLRPDLVLRPAGPPWPPMCAPAAWSGGENRAVLRIRAAALYGVWAVLSCREELLALAGGGSYQPLLEKGAAFFATLPGLLFPVSGWAAGLIGGIFAFDWLQAVLCGGLLAALFAVLLGLILTCKNNYYEDVLSTAETAQSAVTAQKEGQLNEVVPKNVKVGKTGLGKGWGASAIYHKHRVENRRSGVFLFSNMSLIFMAVIIGAAPSLCGRQGW